MVLITYNDKHNISADVSCSAVLAWLGLKALALAWPEAALAFSNARPGQCHQPRLGLGLAWPRPWLLYVKYKFFSIQVTNGSYYSI